MLNGFENKLSHHAFIPAGDVLLLGFLRFILLVSLAAFFSSCSSTALLPRQQKIVVTPWNSFEEAKNAFDQVKPYQTRKDELEKLGFTPEVTPNIKILNYLDIMERFMPNQSITTEDLAEGLQDCLADQEQCMAYEIFIRRYNSQRFGNVFLDLFNFRRKTTVSGWDFMALIVIKNSLVVYKLSSGRPNTDELDDAKNPLGPLQSADRLIWTIAP
jgi:hypothetical protein